MARRGTAGGVSIDKQGIFEYNEEGNAKRTKRVWIRNVKEDGSLEAYLNRLERKIQQENERRKSLGIGRLGESKGPLVIDVTSTNDEYHDAPKEGSDGESDKRNGKGTRTSSSKKGNGKEERKWNLDRDTESIQSILKETMAGSMRQVIKDELQAWLGLKFQNGIEEKNEVQDANLWRKRT